MGKPGMLQSMGHKEVDALSNGTTTTWDQDMTACGQKSPEEFYKERVTEGGGVSIFERNATEISARIICRKLQELFYKVVECLILYFCYW